VSDDGPDRRVGSGRSNPNGTVPPRSWRYDAASATDVRRTVSRLPPYPSTGAFGAENHLPEQSPAAALVVRRQPVDDGVDPLVVAPDDALAEQFLDQPAPSRRVVHGVGGSGVRCHLSGASGLVEFRDDVIVGSTKHVLPWRRNRRWMQGEHERAEAYADRTPLTEVFGRSARVRILAALLGEHDDDRDVADIARHAGVARSTVYDHLDDLQRLDLVERTRTVGPSPTYRFDADAELGELVANVAGVALRRLLELDGELPQDR
jgi:DNA-binding transcriptional ArsR family regulator